MKQWFVCLCPGVLILITDPVSRVSPRDFSVLSPKHSGPLWVREERRRGLTFNECVGGLISQNVWMKLAIDALRWRKWGLVACLTSSAFHERDWAAACCLQILHLTHSQAELLWPKLLRFALRGLRFPEYLPGALPGHQGAQTWTLAS